MQLRRLNGKNGNPFTQLSTLNGMNGSYFSATKAFAGSKFTISTNCNQWRPYYSFPPKRLYDTLSGFHLSLGFVSPFG